MIDIKGKGPIWFGVFDQAPPEHTIWFREIDPPYRHGRGVRVGRLAFGLCRRDHSGEDDKSALNGRDLEVPVNEIRDWKGPKRAKKEEGAERAQPPGGETNPADADRRPDPVG